VCAWKEDVLRVYYPECVRVRDTFSEWDRIVGALAAPLIASRLRVHLRDAHWRVFLVKIGGCVNKRLLYNEKEAWCIYECICM
jgi:hypothetical protein